MYRGFSKETQKATPNFSAVVQGVMAPEGLAQRPFFCAGYV